MGKGLIILNHKYTFHVTTLPEKVYESLKIGVRFPANISLK